ncbi:unnamed protein product [Echinostoma caproni]|uniref:Uncharacterized protein n=1 Tax=Echinostoma caproni TaxID=27848 RepID=A0A3P8L048_9TREM|nr:unnamed protein product [Echinostoma caproni]
MDLSIGITMMFDVSLKLQKRAFPRQLKLDLPNPFLHWCSRRRQQN